MSQEKNAVLCLGEALMDVVSGADRPTREHVGGSPLNVAAGLASLDHPASLCAWWGPDERGARLEAWASTSGVAIVPGTAGASRTAVARAQLDAEGRATYEFDIEWDVPELTDLDGYGHLHTGSIAATLEPGGTRVVEVVRGMREHATVSYDPNIRPALMVEPARVLERVETLVGLSDVVKASDEDLGWLYPGESVEDVMRRWLRVGPAMVVVTCGPQGAYAMLAGQRDLRSVAQVNVEVGDTVGAGDSFMAGLVSGLLDADLLGSARARRRLRDAGWDDVEPALRRAAVTSGITVSQHGAYAPGRDEVAAVQDDPTRD